MFVLPAVMVLAFLMAFSVYSFIKALRKPVADTMDRHDSDADQSLPTERMTA